MSKSAELDRQEQEQERENQARREAWEERQDAADKATDRLAEDLSRWVNRAGDEDYKRLAEAILRDHRTLQQKTFGLMLTTIGKWAELPENHYDLRNEATVTKCREIVKYLGEYGLKLPCI